MEDIVGFVLKFGAELGAEYVEARYQEDLSESTVLKNGVPEISVAQRSRGVGIRVLYKRSLGFSSTNLLTKREISNSVKKAVKMAKATSKLLKKGVKLSNERLCRGKVEVSQKIKLEDVDVELRVEALKEADGSAVEVAEKGGIKLPARIISLDTLSTEKLVVTSDGANVYSRIPRVALSLFLTAFHPQKGAIQRYSNLGESSGWEAVEKWSLPDYFKEEAEALSKILLTAKALKGRKTDLILGPEVVGIVCHESSGHPAEADRILGREAAQAGETYLKGESLGMRVGSEMVNVVDDPTLDHSFGFYLYDDEGVKAERRFLIREGIINDFLHNRETAHVFGVRSNASSRANAYNREPIVRMANTFLQPGEYSFKELIEDIRDGVYINNFMEWNIDDRRFNQRYVGLEAYKIKDGELTHLIRNPVLEVTTVGLWSAIDAVGEDLEFQAAYCGKGDPMQGIPVWTGGPHIRLRGVRVGGSQA